ncbi:MAG: TIGR01212 family radical SAM protein [Candidatus Hydrothermota bacterium]|nr:MAG: TIGR01212 family radical SAM protein [Candidatus Hydrothermae bacterium]
MFEEWCGKRYYSFSCHLKKIFGEKVYRVSLDAGFTCPNRDGTLGYGGCIFCDEAGSRAGYVKPEIPVIEQLRKGIEFIREKFGANKFIAYFQAFSNTYAPPEKLRELYWSVFEIKDVVGISISTRPDLVSEEVLDVIEEIAEKHYVWLEIGVQSMHLRSLEKVKRMHGVAENIDAILRTKKRRNILILAHVILGLPGETVKEMIETARVLSVLGIDGIKMHHLYVVEGTPLAEIYRRGKLKIFETPREYAEVAVKFIEHLAPKIIIHRLAGRAVEGLVAPLWSSNKFVAQQEIEKILEELNTWQGKALKVGL